MTNFSEMLATVDEAKMIEDCLEKQGGFVPNNRILLVAPTEGKTKGGIYIPNTAQESIPKTGVVVQMGSISNDELDFALNLRTGDLVTFGLYSGTKVEPMEIPLLKDMELRVISLHEIMYCETRNKE